jgi:DhnA family fructose-bisphosphate aldolase class Ia
MNVGKQIRMNRIINSKSGKVFFATIDHGFHRGVLPGIDNIAAAIQKIADGGPDVMTMHKGLAKKYFPPYAANICLAIKSTTFSPYHPNLDVPVADVEEVQRLGADAVSIGLLTGTRDQPAMFAHMGRISRQCEERGMPLIVHAYPKGELIKDDERYSYEHVSYSVRAAVECGADIVKTWYTGDYDSFARVVEASHGRVVVAGGAKMKDTESFFKVTHDVIRAGALGVAYGRNIFQAENPTRMVTSLKSIIHEGSTPDHAMEVLRG